MIRPIHPIHLRLREIRQRCGARVAQIVDGSSDIRGSPSAELGRSLIRPSPGGPGVEDYPVSAR